MRPAACVTFVVLLAGWATCERAAADGLPPPEVRVLRGPTAPFPAAPTPAPAPAAPAPSPRMLEVAPPPPAASGPLAAAPAPVGPPPGRRPRRREVARGPFEVRDEWLLAQPRLTLPAVSPDPVPVGVWRVRLHFNVGNDFGWRQSGVGEMPSDRRFLVDGEHRTLEVGVRRGVLPGLDVGLRVPLRCRGGGVLDGFIDFFHEITDFVTRDNARDDFFNDRFRVEGRDENFRRFEWTEEGVGLGNVELEGHWAFLRPPCPTGLRAALVGRLGLPTGTGPFETGSVEAGLQVVAAQRLWGDLDVYAGAGGTWFSERWIDGVEYVPLRASGFVALEYRPLPRLSILLQGDVTSRLVDNVALYPAVQSYLHGGFKYDLGAGWRFVLGMSENLEDQQATVDVGFFAGLEGTF